MLETKKKFSQLRIHGAEISSAAISRSHHALLLRAVRSGGAEGLAHWDFELFSSSNHISPLLNRPQGCQGCQKHRKDLTPNSSLKQTSLTYPKLNMDDFSALTGQLGQVHMAKEIFPIFLHAEQGIRKGKESGIIYATFINQSFLPKSSIVALALRLVFSLLIRKVKQH